MGDGTRSRRLKQNERSERKRDGGTHVDIDVDVEILHIESLHPDVDADEGVVREERC